MALSVQLFTFSKKPNSTALPSGSGTPALIELKAPTDVVNPEFTIAGIPNPYVFNYCHISEFSRYYFIENWRWDMGRWIAVCRVDVLGSYKTAIGNSYQYVLRSASAFDGMIVDGQYPLTRDFDFDSATVATGRPLTYVLYHGYYMIGVLSKTGSIGAVNYYLFNTTQFDALKQALFNDISWTGVSDVSAQMLATMFNPFDYIVSCKWIPITNAYNYFSASAVSVVNIGWWSFNVNAYLITGNINVVDWNFNIPASSFGQHPQAARGEYLNGQPYTEYDLLLAPYGIIKLPNECQLHGCGVEELIDGVTGECILKIGLYNQPDGYYAPLVTVKSQMFVDIQLAQVRSAAGWENTSNKAYDFIGDQIKRLGDNAITRKISNIIDVMKAETEVISRFGMNGSLASIAEFFGPDASIVKISQYIAQEDNAHFGRPLLQTRQLSTLSGYTLCGDAEIAIDGTKTESEQILAYLNAGFFME